METIINVSLLVKGNVEAAKHEFAKRLQLLLMEWMGETTEKDCKPGVGYPVGALLHFSHSVKPVTRPDPNGVDRLYEAVMKSDVDRTIAYAALDGFSEDFKEYVEDGKPMGRDLTREESTWVYLNLK